MEVPPPIFLRRLVESRKFHAKGPRILFEVDSNFKLAHVHLGNITMHP